MQEVMLKTHLFVSDVHEEYVVDWCGKIADTKPIFKNNLPVFIIIGSQGRIELNTIDMKLLVESAKKLTYPRGRKAVTTDVSRIYIKEEDEKLTLMCVVMHHHVKQYKQMYDPFMKI